MVSCILCTGLFLDKAMQSLKSDLIEFQDGVSETVDADNCFSDIAHLALLYHTRTQCTSSTQFHSQSQALSLWLYSLQQESVRRKPMIQNRRRRCTASWRTSDIGKNIFLNSLKLTGQTDVQLADFYLLNCSINTQTWSNKISTDRCTAE